MIEWIVGGAAMALAGALARSGWKDAHTYKPPTWEDRQRLMDEGWGLAQVYWNPNDAAPLDGIERSFGPIEVNVTAFKLNMVFVYYVVGHTPHAHMHRKSGGETLTFEERQAVCDSVQLLAAKQFGAETRRKVLAWKERQARQIEQQQIAEQAREAVDAEFKKSACEKAEHFERELGAKADAVRHASGSARDDAVADIARFTASCIAVIQAMATEGRSEREFAVRQATSRIQLAHNNLAARLEKEARDAEWAAHEARLLEGIRLKEAEQERHHARISADIRLQSAGSLDRIVFGTDVESGEDIRLPVAKIPHCIVAGASGSGKSVFLHQLVYQLVHHADVEQIILVDMKGGVEFDRYREFPAVRIVWEIADVMAAVEGLVSLMEERQAIMRENRWQNWRGKRVFFVVDEYAEIQNDIADARADKARKPAAVRLEGNLVRLARRARALGIVFICAMQKATADAIGSSVRGNLSLRICFRAPSREAAAALLDDWDDAPQHPQRLKVGRFLYFDASRGGRIRHMQTHIAPDVEVSRD